MMTDEQFHACEVLGRLMLDRYGLTTWRISRHNLRNWVGTKGGKTRGAIMTTVFADNPLSDGKGPEIQMDHGLQWRDFPRTMLHEISHALDPRGNDAQPHDIVWVKAALKIGLTWNEVREAYAEEHYEGSDRWCFGIPGCGDNNYEKFIRALLPLKLGSSTLRRDPRLATWGVKVKRPSHPTPAVHSGFVIFHGKECLISDVRKKLRKELGKAAAGQGLRKRSGGK